MDDLHKEEVVAKAATASLKVLDMIMQAMRDRDTKNPLFCPDYQSFLKLVNDPKHADIKEILERTKAEIIKSEVNRLELRQEIMKQRNHFNL